MIEQTLWGYSPHYYQLYEKDNPENTKFISWRFEEEEYARNFRKIRAAAGCKPCGIEEVTIVRKNIE